MNNMLPFPPPPRMAQQGQQPDQGAAQFNPMRMIVNRFMGGMTPMAILDQMAGPQVQQAKKIIGGKSQDQLKQIATNMAKERGIELSDLAAQLGIQLPK